MASLPEQPQSINQSINQSIYWTKEPIGHLYWHAWIHV